MHYLVASGMPKWKSSYKKGNKYKILLKTERYIAKQCEILHYMMTNSYLQNGQIDKNSPEVKDLLTSNNLTEE